MKQIIKKILKWLLKKNKKGNNLIKNYNIKFFNKKIKPFLKQDIAFDKFQNSINN